MRTIWGKFRVKVTSSNNETQIIDPPYESPLGEIMSWDSVQEIVIVRKDGRRTKYEKVEE